MTNPSTPLLQMVQQHTAQNRISFHMPVHNGGGAFAPLAGNLAALDVTELPQTDNLAHPGGGILEAQRQMAEIYKSGSAHLLVNGATCGIHAMLMYTCKRGDTVIMDSAAHQSAINACIALDLSIAFMKRGLIDDFTIAAPLSPQEVQNVLDRHPHASAVLLTSPTYYGICNDIAAVARVTKKAGVPLLVDSAHGAHFAFSGRFPAMPVEQGADMCVVSLHKTLGALNQTALLLCGNGIDAFRIQQCINIYQTSSPSYILMCVADWVIADMRASGEQRLNSAIAGTEEAKRRIEAQTLCRCMSPAYAPCDPLRLTVNFSRCGITGYEAAQILASQYRIDVEMADIVNIVCIVSHNTPRAHLDLLTDAVCAIAANAGPVPALSEIIAYAPPARLICPAKAFFGERKAVPLEQSIGMTAAANVTVYPPGIAAIVCGGVIDEGVVKYIQDILRMGGDVTGMENGQVDVCAG